MIFVLNLTKKKRIFPVIMHRKTTMKKVRIHNEDDDDGAGLWPKRTLDCGSDVKLWLRLVIGV